MSTKKTTEYIALENGFKALMETVRLMKEEIAVLRAAVANHQDYIDSWRDDEDDESGDEEDAESGDEEEDAESGDEEAVATTCTFVPSRGSKAGQICGGPLTDGKCKRQNHNKE